jgi:hypothetical protein
VHLGISGPAAPLANIPEVYDLLAGVVARADQVLAQTAIHLPSPTIAAAWTLHIRVLHRIIVSKLLLLAEAASGKARELGWITGQ